jgi:hypothetical protein
MDWMSKHASEILVAVITALVIKGLDYLLARRSKVVFFYTGGASFNLTAPGQANALASIITLALWNTGRAVAEDIRIVHAYFPNNYQVWPPMPTTVNTLPSGHRELQIPRILPHQIVYISYLDLVPLTSAMIIQMSAKDHQINAITWQFMKVFPQWINRVVQILFFLGVLVAVRYLYIGGVALIRFLITVSGH